MDYSKFISSRPTRINVEGGEDMTIEVAMAFNSMGIAVVVNDGNKVTLKKDEK